MIKQLRDNKKRDKYYYQIIVFTGMRNDAGTKSKVNKNNQLRFYPNTLKL